MYLFIDLIAERFIIFTTEEKANNFFKEYKRWYFQETGAFPEKYTDYMIIQPDIDEEFS